MTQQQKNTNQQAKKDAYNAYLEGLRKDPGATGRGTPPSQDPKLNRAVEAIHSLAKQVSKL